MATTLQHHATDFLSSLTAQERSPLIPEEFDVYGWLIGSWKLEVLFYTKDLTGKGFEGEAHFSRTLRGLAIQDTWTLPSQESALSAAPSKETTTGTTLRLWDAALKAWRITWVNPASGARDELIGRKIGKEIVQLGTNKEGSTIRWRFQEITAESFLWTGEVLLADAETWRMTAIFRAHRRK